MALSAGPNRRRALAPGVCSLAWLPHISTLRWARCPSNLTLNLELSEVAIGDIEQIASLFGPSLARRHQRRQYANLPLLNDLLPVLEYEPEQLSRSVFGDNTATAAVKAAAAMYQAAELLSPFGIEYEDLRALLQARMNEQWKAQKSRRKKRE